MMTYAEHLRQSRLWLADHAADRGRLANHGPCTRCGQNMQLLNGRPIAHRARHLTNGATPWCITPATAR